MPSMIYHLSIFPLDIGWQSSVHTWEYGTHVRLHDNGRATWACRVRHRDTKPLHWDKYRGERESDWQLCSIPGSARARPTGMIDSCERVIDSCAPFLALLGQDPQVWLTARGEWLTAVREWLTAVREWLTAVREWLTAVREWLTAEREWLTAVREIDSCMRVIDSWERVIDSCAPFWPCSAQAGPSGMIDSCKRVIDNIFNDWKTKNISWLCYIVNFHHTSQFKKTCFFENISGVTRAEFEQHGGHVIPIHSGRCS